MATVTRFSFPLWLYILTIASFGAITILGVILTAVFKTVPLVILTVLAAVFFLLSSVASVIHLHYKSEELIKKKHPTEETPLVC